ncbi:hypothetical protein B0J13DRAFT_24956 [Dactylonectria estremocensis]|uniref:Uncharacterized protein n=1 Tax=Dactylonectria estremocensis TaxID=1079267 RepID=A0A9P9FL70_9HYPO|nr:hypothetical protein B0J13DRAFT_24956 [Dactylonectria estremocensis]
MNCEFCKRKLEASGFFQAKQTLQTRTEGTARRNKHRPSPRRPGLLEPSNDRHGRPVRSSESYNGTEMPHRLAFGFLASTTDDQRRDQLGVLEPSETPAVPAFWQAGKPKGPKGTCGSIENTQISRLMKVLRVRVHIPTTRSPFLGRLESSRCLEYKNRRAHLFVIHLERIQESRLFRLPYHMFSSQVIHPRVRLQGPRFGGGLV